MKNIFIEYPKCSTCKKAKKWLEENNVEFIDRNIIKETPTFQELNEWIKKSGQELKKWFNTSGLKYKELNLKDKLVTMSDIIISPEYLRLIEEVKQLKEDIASLYEEKDELGYHICKNIETEYMSKVGILEYKLFEFQCEILRLKRKIELYQIKINRQEIPNEKEIEEKLNIEYKEYKQKLNQMSNDLQDALNRKNYGILSEENSKELKSIYRKLIKKLHPDLNNEDSEKNKNLLLQVTRAYENGDLETLKNLELLTDEITEKENIEIGDFEELKQSKEKYKIITNELLESIKKIKESFPYNKKEFLKSDILVKKRKKELENEMEMCKEVYSNLENILKQLKGEPNG